MDIRMRYIIIGMNICVINLIRGNCRLRIITFYNSIFYGITCKLSFLHIFFLNDGNVFIVHVRRFCFHR